jgi:hypothetical protein
MPDEVKCAFIARHMILDGKAINWKNGELLKEEEAKADAIQKLEGFRKPSPAGPAPDPAPQRSMPAPVRGKSPGGPIQ